MGSFSFMRTRRTNRALAQAKDAHATTPSQAQSRAARSSSVERDEDQADSRARDRAEDGVQREGPPSEVSIGSALARFLAGGWAGADVAAVYMDLSLSVTRRAIRRGDLRAFRIGSGRAIRLKREHCDEFLLKQQAAEPVKARR